MAHTTTGRLAREERQANAQVLLAERAKRTPEEQLARLDKMFGVGQGATKERARLLKLTTGVTPGEQLLKDVFEKPAKKKRKNR